MTYSTTHLHSDDYRLIAQACDDSGADVVAAAALDLAATRFAAVVTHAPTNGHTVSVWVWHRAGCACDVPAPRGWEELHCAQCGRYDDAPPLALHGGRLFADVLPAMMELAAMVHAARVSDALDVNAAHRARRDAAASALIDCLRGRDR